MAFLTRLIAVVCVGVAACVTPVYPENLQCGPSGQCPPGQGCASDHTCHSGPFNNTGKDGGTNFGCPMPGSTAGCAAGNICDNTHNCVPAKGDGGSATMCPTPGSSNGCPLNFICNASFMCVPFGSPDANNGQCATVPTFGAMTTYPVGKSPQNLAVGDFNHDGFPDVAVANNSSNVVSIYHGLGGGNLGNELDLPVPATCGGAGSVQAVDIDKDGFDDLIVSGQPGCNAVELHRQDKASPGSFLTAQTIPMDLSSSPDGAGVLPVGDLNGDGRLDLAYFDGKNNGVSVLFQGTSPGQFSPLPMTILPAGSSTGLGSQVMFADMNNDGQLDIITVGDNTAKVIFQVTGMPGTFLAARDVGPAGTTMSVIACKYNGDALTDLLIGTSPMPQFYYQDPANFGMFVPGPTINAPLGGAASKSGVGCTDVNGDGRIDVATHGVFVLQCAAPQGPGNWSTMINMPVTGGGGGQFAVFADVNKDGKPDLLYTQTVGTANGLLVVQLAN